MSPESQASEALPSRRRRTPRGGRHRGDESFLLPPDSPVLVLAVPGPAGQDGGVAAELARLVEIENTGQPTQVGYLEGEEGGLGSVLAGLAPVRPDEPAAVVVPLLPGPDPAADEAIRATLEGSDVRAVVAEPLGPHPLIAESLHDRLADAGLARADRIRMMTMVTAAGGVIVVTPGDAFAVRQAEVAGVLLASRLAAPVFTAQIDDTPAVEAAAAQLRGSGVARLAVAPYLIGPEGGDEHLASAAAAAGAEHSEPMGAHPALARLAALRYAEALSNALSA